MRAQGCNSPALLDLEHHGTAERLHVEADDIRDLLGEGGIVRLLESAQAIRLEAVGVSDLLDRPQADADPPRNIKNRQALG